jgi:hypothetical protein
VNLTPHFTLEELTRTGRGVPNEAPEAVRRELQHLAEFLLEPIREMLGVPMQVTSGYRSPALERLVQGVGPDAPLRSSQHMLGQACDFVPSGMPVWQAYELIARSGLPFDQLICEAVGGGHWIHVSCAPSTRMPRQMAGLITDREAWIPYRPGLAFGLEHPEAPKENNA